MGLIMPQLETPQAKHTPMSLHESNEMGRKHSLGLVCSNSIQLQARVNTLFKDEQSSLRGKPWSFQPSQEGHKWVQETNGGLHKGNELNLTAPE